MNAYFSIAIDLFYLHIRKRSDRFRFQLEENKSVTLKLWNFFRIGFFLLHFEHLSILI